MSPEEEALFEYEARVISVMAHPKRLAIITLLGKREHTVSELSEATGLAQATTSQHLAAMRDVGLVQTRREGTYIHYRLADANVSKACAAMRKAMQGLLIQRQERFRPVVQVARKRR